MAPRRSNYFTKSGTNKFHGDLYELWDGSLFSAEDYFLHANDTPGNITPKPRSNVNHFGYGVGGPIRKNKLFFFTAYEGVRIALPIVTQAVVPSPAYQQYVLNQLPLGGDRPHHRNRSPAEPAEVAFYQSMFASTATLRERRSRSAPAPSMPAARCCPAPDQRQPLQRQRLRQPAPGVAQNSDHETVFVVKIDHTINAPTPSGTAFKRTPACRPRTPIPSIPSSTPTLRSRSTRLSPATHTSSAQSRQPVQSRRKLVLEHL